VNKTKLGSWSRSARAWFGRIRSWRRSHFIFSSGVGARTGTL